MRAPCRPRPRAQQVDGGLRGAQASRHDARVVSVQLYASLCGAASHKGLLQGIEFNYQGPSDAEGYGATPLDVYFLLAVPTVHFITPGLLMQPHKEHHGPRMDFFSETCSE